MLSGSRGTRLPSNAEYLFPTMFTTSLFRSRSFWAVSSIQRNDPRKHYATALSTFGISFLNLFSSLLDAPSHFQIPVFQYLGGRHEEKARRDLHQEGTGGSTLVCSG
jgi:hypothetical protein